MRCVELDLLVIGSGPSGQKAAIQGAKLGKRVAVAERRDRLGGVSIHTGTIPSKTLREAVLDQLAERPLDVLDPTRLDEAERQALQQLMDRAAHVVAAETASAGSRATPRSRTRTPCGSRAPTSRSARSAS
jgi:NAD(P) transhydrogenase